MGIWLCSHAQLSNSPETPGSSGVLQYQNCLATIVCYCPSSFELDFSLDCWAPSGRWVPQTKLLMSLGTLLDALVQPLNLVLYVQLLSSPHGPGLHGTRHASKHCQPEL